MLPQQHKNFLWLQCTALQVLEGNEILGSVGEIIRYLVYSIFINIHFENDEGAIMGPHIVLNH